MQERTVTVKQRGEAVAMAAQTSTSDSSFLFSAFATGSPIPLSSAAGTSISVRFCLQGDSRYLGNVYGCHWQQAHELHYWDIPEAMCNSDDVTTAVDLSKNLLEHGR